MKIGNQHCEDKGVSMLAKSINVITVIKPNVKLFPICLV